MSLVETTGSNDAGLAFTRSEKIQLALKLVLPVVAGAFLMAAIYASVYWSAGGADDVAAARQTRLFQLVISKLRMELAHEQESVTVWDEAIDAVTAQTKDQEWLDMNLGRWMHTYFGHDGAFVLSSAGRPVYAFWRAERRGPEAFDEVADAAMPLIRNLKSRLAAGDESGITQQVLSIGESDFVVIDARPAVISVKPIVSDTGNRTQAPDEIYLHVAVRYLDRRYLTTLGEEYAFDDLQFHNGIIGDQSRATAPLTTRSGQVAGYFSWSPFSPGADLIRATTPILAATTALILALTVSMGASIWNRSRRLKTSQAQLNHLAFHDGLTGLANRRTFHRRLAERLNGASKPRELAVLYMDLDRFKQVNDMLGHPVGDALIIAVAKRLNEAAGLAETIARIGGDEFTAIIAHTNRQDVEKQCQRLIDAIQEPFEVKGHPIRIGLSIGVSMLGSAHGTQHKSADEMMREADIALYHAKGAGRNCYAIFGAHMDELIKMRRELERDLRAALEAKDQFEIHYQPVYSALGRQITGVEALLRWRHPLKGLIPPDMFIGLAEEIGVIEKIGSLVLKEACTAALPWEGLGLSVNASALEMRNPNYARNVLAVLNELKFKPERLEIEITETALVDEDGQCEKNIRALRADGVRFALDDFGTGFSSFGRLQRLEVDRIKIDRSFVSGFGTPGGNEEIVQAIIGLAHAKGLKTTAEGIETIEQQEALCRLGCDELQGFLLSRPVPSKVIAEILQQRGSTIET